VSVERSRQCADCGSPLAEDQHYCLRCGARIGVRSAQLEGILRRVGGQAHSRAGAVQSAAAPIHTAPASTRTPGLRLPSPRISALLVLVFLGFGVILGRAAATRVSDTLASTRSPLKVVLPAAGSSDASPPASPTASESSSSSAGSTPPPAESEPTPTAAATAGTHTSASKSSPEGGSAGSQGGSPESKGGPSGAKGGSSESSGGGAATTLPPVEHVFVIMLSDEPYASVFGPSSAAPYLSGTLEHRGELLVRYDAVAHEELADELALLSGQGPTVETAANCPTYTEITGASAGPEEQVLGNGCVYPSSTQTLLGQLSEKHLTGRAYVQGIDEAGAQAGACAHPALGQPDPTAEQSASTGPYATFRNPFVYFASVVDSPACATADVGSPP
jgi:hypothetical protein